MICNVLGRHPCSEPADKGKTAGRNIVLWLRSSECVPNVFCVARSWNTGRRHYPLLHKSPCPGLHAKDPGSPGCSPGSGPGPCETTSSENVAFPLTERPWSAPCPADMYHAQGHRLSHRHHHQHHHLRLHHFENVAACQSPTCTRLPFGGRRAGGTSTPRPMMTKVGSPLRGILIENRS